jgi:hypothetical protein
MSRRGKVALLLGLGLFWVLVALVHYRTPKAFAAPEPQALYEVVRQQVYAMQAGDLPAAYRQTSESFQQHWSRELFPGYIQSSCARMLDAARMEFGPIQLKEGRAVVRVYFTQADGTISPCLITLIREHGGWRIDDAAWLKESPRKSRLPGLQS